MCALLFGCYSYRPPPEIVEGEDYTTKTRVEHRGLPVDESVLTLDLATQVALANNPDYTATRHSMTAAYARYYQSFSRFLPTVSGNFGVGQSQLFTPQAPGDTKWGITNSTNIGLSGQWVVFNGMIDTMNMLAARASAKQSEALNRDARRLLISAVTSTYHQAQLNIAQIQIAEANELFQQAMVDDTQIKYDSGEAPLRDLLDFQIRRDEAVNSLLELRLNYTTTRLVLAELLGLTTGELPAKTTICEMETTSAMDYTLDIEFYLDMAISQRPDLQAFREALSASTYNLYAAWGSFLPTAALNMNYGRNDSWPINYSHSWNVQYGYGMGANWLLFDGGSRWMQVRQAQAYLAISKEQLAGGWISVLKNVRQAHANLTTNICEAKVRKGILEMARQERDMVRDAYNAGEESIVRVNQAQNDLIRAQLNYSSAIISIENSKSELEKACGSR